MLWLIGCHGMLGTEVARQLTEKNIAFVGTGHEVDITNLTALESFASAQKQKITFIINCSAYTAVDKAESEVELANKINTDGARNIARIAKKLGAKLIHISTDYVFDGTGKVPYTEDMSVAPLGVYGRTKADGEKAIQNELAEYYILRTAWLYGWAGKNFVYTMIKAMNTHPSVKVVNDQKGSPTFTLDLAQIIIKIIEQNKNEKPVPFGIYHVTDLGVITWYEFVLEIKKQAVKLGLITNADCVVNPCTTQDYPTPAKRPSYSVLSKQKIQNALNMQVPDWKESLKLFLSSSNFDKNRLV